MSTATGVLTSKGCNQRDTARANVNKESFKALTQTDRPGRGFQNCHRINLASLSTGSDSASGTFLAAANMWVSFFTLSGCECTQGDLRARTRLTRRRLYRDRKGEKSEDTVRERVGKRQPNHDCYTISDRKGMVVVVVGGLVRSEEKSGVFFFQETSGFG